jgi:hypothetical protein
MPTKSDRPGSWVLSRPLMEGLDLLATLRSFVKAHAQPHPSTKGREPIFYFHHSGGGTLAHHALPDPPPHVDDALLEEMHDEGLLDIEYGQGNWKLTPTPAGREVIQQQDRIAGRARVANIAPLIEALSAQADSDNKLTWPVVRPILATIRGFWEAGGYSSHGLPLRTVFDALPDEHHEMFATTVRSLIEGDYLRGTPGLVALDLPAEVVITKRAHVLLDGWPGAEPSELGENLLAVLAAAIATETDPDRRGRLQRWADTARDVGVSAAGELLARTLAGGL